jgi:hypothetical protein
MKIGDILFRIENSRYVNWKTIIGIYLLTRISLILLLNFSTWNGSPLLCYAVDCKQHWRNAQLVVNGINPYLVWKEMEGTPALPLLLRADHPPFMYILLPSFVWIWKSVWSMLLLYFIFDFINLCLISSLSKFKKIPALLYIFAPSIFRGLVFAEDEIMCVTFALASIYFFRKNQYSLSTLMLALSFNLKFFPIVLFPTLLMCMNIFQKTKSRIFPNIEYLQLVKQVGIFSLVTLFFHSFFYPHWDIYYQYRTFHRTLWFSGNGIWNILPLSVDTYYIPILLSIFSLFYLYLYFRRLDIKTGYFITALLFLSTYPHFSFDHLIFLIPLFLIWTRLRKQDIVFWIILTVGVIIEFLGLPTIGFITPFQRQFIGPLLLVSFYFVLINRIYAKEG